MLFRSADARSIFFDSMYHSAAVVGLNTSAMIEAGIVGRRSLTVLTPQYRDSQEGTIHFSHLTRDDFLICSSNFEEHFERLECQITGDPTSGPTIRRFLEAFVRPNGLGSPAARHVVEAIESAAQRPPLPDDSLGWMGAPVRVLAKLAISRWIAVPDEEGAKVTTAGKHFIEEDQDASDGPSKVLKIPKVKAPKASKPPKPRKASA